MPSPRSVLLTTTAALASAQYTTSSAASSSYVDSAMPTLPSPNPQDWSQWNTWGQSQSSYPTSAYGAAPSSYSSVSTHLPVPVSSGAYSAYPTVSVSTSSQPYENPFTVYLSQTNSLGVVTGMPSVVTSQPQVVTSQAVAATVPAGVVPTSVTTLVTTTLAPSSSGTGRNATFNQNTTTTTSAPIASHTGGASLSGRPVAGASFALIVAGLVFTLF